jgi:hypothetical protein
MLREHDADDVSGGLPYLEMAAITLFLADRVRSDETEHFPAFFAAVERCLLEGTREAIELVVVGLLEDLQNRNITKLENGVWQPFLGPTTRRAWRAVEDFWNGDTEALGRFAV